MAVRRSDRKKQTRLGFTPLESSSPQRSQAFVRSSAPAKRRKTGANSSPSSDLLNHSSPLARVQILVNSPSPISNQLPTPAPSSQIEPEAHQTEDIHAREREQSAASVVKSDEALGLAFSSSEDEGPVQKSTRRARPRAISISSKSNDSSDSSAPVTPSKHRTKNSASDFIARTTPQKTSTPYRPSGARNFLLGGRQGNAPIAHGGLRKVWKSPNSKPRKKSVPIEIGNSGSSFEGDISVSNSPKRNLRSSASLLPKSTPRKNNTVDWQFSDSENDGVLARDQNRRNNVSSDAPLTSGVPVIVPHPSQETDSDVLATPKRQRGSKSTKFMKPPSNDAGERSELEAEVADLADSDGAQNRADQGTHVGMQPRSSKRGQRLSKLQELRRRRAGVIEVSDDDSNSDRPEYTNVEDGVSDHDHSDVYDQPSNLDEYEADFIDEDGEDDIIGVDLARGGVPLELTGFANLKPFEYFKYEVEWMVHNKLDPAFERNDEIYRMSHQKLNDEVEGHAGSTFKSSVWRPEFTAALMSRPNLFRADVPAMLENKCEACNRSGHPPKHKLMLNGSKYDKDSLEKITSDESDEEDDDYSQERSQNEEIFFLGRFCCANAEIAHTLYHWRFHLNETILRWLSTEGHTTADRIVEREHWTRKKKEKLANKVVDGMVEDGEMKVLYRQFKQNLQAARDSKVSLFALLEGKRSTLLMSR